ncbi:hypothetical protein EBQ81_06900 [bacterium]|jgi:hypothetical protein|nr:hypothetical protein [bacterium]NBX98552.1 hypothetical protein [bacterium]
MGTSVKTWLLFGKVIVAPVVGGAALIVPVRPTESVLVAAYTLPEKDTIKSNVVKKGMMVRKYFIFAYVYSLIVQTITIINKPVVPL